MSIATSREEREQAAAKAAEETSEQLRADLEYWTVAKLDHHKAWIGLKEQELRVEDLHNEARAWVDLIAEELHGRRHRDLES